MINDSPTHPPSTPLTELIHGPTPRAPVRVGNGTGDSDVVYGVSIVGEVGRILDRHIMNTFNWTSGTHLTIRPVDSVLLVDPEPNGPVRVTTDGYFRIPFRQRRRVNRLEQHSGNKRLDQITKVDLDDMARIVEITSRINRASGGGIGAVEHFVKTVRCVYRYAEDRGGFAPATTRPTTRATGPARITPLRHTTTPAHRDLSRRIGHRQRPRIRHAHPAPVPGNNLPTQRRPHTAPPRPRHHPMPHPPARKPVATRIPHPHATPRHPRRATPQPPIRTAPALPQWNTRHQPPPRPPLDPPRPRTPWVTVQGITAHWLRHTTLTWVERNYGYAVARAYAGHTSKNSGTTTTYIKASPHEVAAALSVLTGEPQPLLEHKAATT